MAWELGYCWSNFDKWLESSAVLGQVIQSVSMDWLVLKFFDDVTVSWSRPDVTLHFLCKCTLTLALWTLIINYYISETFIKYRICGPKKDHTEFYWYLPDPWTWTCEPCARTLYRKLPAAGVSPEFQWFAYPIVSPLVLSVIFLWLHQP